MRQIPAIIVSLLLLLFAAGDACAQSKYRSKRSYKSKSSYYSGKRSYSSGYKSRGYRTDSAEDADSAERTEAAAPKNNENTAFIVISKADLHLRVYDKDAKGDTVLLRQYPACLGRNKGQKRWAGDCCTPEATPQKLFFNVTSIEDSSDWKFDFNDGKGRRLAYGDWFLRLSNCGFSSIGIHGSTGNEWSIPGSRLAKPSDDSVVGRDSEGCIRLSDSDIIDLKEKYAYIGMPVLIKPEGVGLLDFEVRADQRYSLSRR